MIDEKARKLLTKLMEHGAVATFIFPDGDRPDFILGHAEFIDGNPDLLRWCAIFPEDQHHVHRTEVDSIETHHDRDIAIHQDGVMVAYICPYEESGLEEGPILEALAEWRALLAKPNPAKQFKRFLEDV
jgi:hypothetical protein